jgi:hypothetical protein
MASVDAATVHTLRELLAPTGWVERSRDFATSMRRFTRTPGGLLLLGTPVEEPWHLTAHLDDEARWSGVAELAPTLVRWAPPPNAPAHLAVDVQRLRAARRGETLLVVAPDATPASMLERVADVRRAGATVLALDAGNDDLEGIAHDALVVPRAATTAEQPSFDVMQHLVYVAAGELPARRGFRDRLGRFLDVVSGPPPNRT